MLSQVLSQDPGRACCVWVTWPELLSLLLPAPDWVESALGMGLSMWIEHGRALVPLWSWDQELQGSGMRTIYSFGIVEFMLKRPLCSGCPVYIGPRLAPRPCALSLRQDSLPPAGPEQGLEPRSEASPAVPATIAIPEPCQCFLVWGRAQSQHPSVRLSAGLLACVLPCINPTSQGLSLVLYPFLTKEPAHTHTGEHTQAFTAPFVWPSGSSLSSSPLEQKRGTRSWDAGSVAVQTPPPSPAPCALDLSLSFLACPGGWKPVQVDPGACLGVGSLIPTFPASRSPF